MPDPTVFADAALVERLRKGDEQAYAQLLTEHGGRLLAVTRRLLRNEEDAHDAVQDAFLSAFRAIQNFSGDSRLSTWLHRIAVNAALMKLRKKAAHAEQSIDSLLPAFLEDGHQAHPARRWGDSVESEVVRAELRARVQRLIAELPSQYRIVLQLRDIEELDTDETAHALGLSSGAVKTRLHRARQALRTLLDREMPNEGQSC